MANALKGKAHPNTIVVKILQLRADWIAKVPKLSDREDALKRKGSDWKKFNSFCGSAHVINDRVNMSMDKYFMFIEAAGLDYDTYWDSEANPNDYISSTNVNRPSSADKEDDKASAPSTVANKDKPEKVYINVTKPNPTEASEVKQKELPKPQNTNEVSPANIVKFEKPVRQSVSSRLNNSSKPTPTVVRTVKYDHNKKIDHSSSAYTTLNSLEQKMNSFRIRLPIYMCALHISTDNVIADTDITYYRDIRDGKADIKLFEYVVLSEYLMKKYNVCTNSEAKSTFKQIAAVFNDIYVQTLYFNDVNSASASN